MAQRLLLDTAEVAAMCGVTEAYLRKQRQLRAGPPYRKIGRLVRYEAADVEKWLDAQPLVLPL